MAIPREITDEMVNDFRSRISDATRLRITDTEIRTGLAAVFAGHVWPQFRTAPGEDGWEREMPDPQERMAAVGERLAEQIEAPPVISDAQWRATAAGIVGYTWQGANLPPGALERMSALLVEWIKTGEIPS